MHFLSTSAKHLLVLPGLQFITASVYIYRPLKTESVSILTFVVLQLFHWRFFPWDTNEFFCGPVLTWTYRGMNGNGHRIHSLLSCLIEWFCLFASLLLCSYFPFSHFFSPPGTWMWINTGNSGINWQGSWSYVKRSERM